LARENYLLIAGRHALELARDRIARVCHAGGLGLGPQAIDGCGGFVVEDEVGGGRGAPADPASRRAAARCAARNGAAA
jgi:hypothetical protein